ESPPKNSAAVIVRNALEYFIGTLRPTLGKAFTGPHYEGAKRRKPPRLGQKVELRSRKRNGDWRDTPMKFHSAVTAIPIPMRVPGVVWLERHGAPDASTARGDE